ncbi:hypothetical protein [Streptomyces echinatus]|uniref:Uncharacterized protein n=1 Tax=Streptomyces echinatus TaxID=67293 RepID=A0A7W9Q325_9ACTN|nr:hypothetical protein [Streptomyces echinatus]MBB5932451.1 hypothetical protein [Streptomyces echinatus]
MIPQSADSIAGLFDQPAQAAVTNRDAVVQLYELLTECLTTPVLMPQLTSDSPDSQLLSRCWDFVDRIVAHSSVYVRGAVHFEVLEPLLDAEGLLQKRLALHEGQNPNTHPEDAGRLRRSRAGLQAPFHPYGRLRMRHPLALVTIKTRERRSQPWPVNGSGAL